MYGLQHPLVGNIISESFQPCMGQGPFPFLAWLLCGGAVFFGLRDTGSPVPNGIDRYTCKEELRLIIDLTKVGEW